MLRVKVLEVRDAGTFVPVVAIEMRADMDFPERVEQERYLLRRVGYNQERIDEHCILLVRAVGGKACYDPYEWGSGERTMHVAHLAIAKHWDELKSGDVVDVEYELGLKPTKKVSERITDPI